MTEPWPIFSCLSVSSDQSAEFRFDTDIKDVPLY